MREIYIRIFLRHISRNLHIAPARCENNITAVRNTLLNRFLRSVLIGIIHDLTLNLVIRQQKILLHSLYTQIMRVGITTSLIRIGQIKNADLNLILADTAFSLLCSVAFALLIALIGGIIIRTAGFYSITAGKQKRRR